MLKTGLVSVSFRNLTAEQLVKEVKNSGLSGIEWGGDVHVPPQDEKNARKVRELTENAGLEVFSYGSYFRAGENAVEDFLPVLKTAQVLGAPSIRVWAGAKWSWRADEQYVKKVVEDTKIICDMAKEKNIKVCYEYHGSTLTDNRFSAVQVKSEIDRPNMYLYWQPEFRLSHTDNLIALKMVLPHMSNVHVFYWDPDGKRFELEEGRELWKEFIKIIKSDDKDHQLMLEFIKDGSLEQFRKDAHTLNSLIAE